jgi:hypothetical protein
MQLTVDLSNLDPRTRDRIVKNAVHEDVAQYQLACIEQARAAQYYRHFAEAGRTKDYAGPLKSIIHPYFRNMLSATASSEKELIWSDPEFLRWLMKREDCFRVEECATRVQVGYQGSRVQGAGCKKASVQGAGCKLQVKTSVRESLPNLHPAPCNLHPVIPKAPHA